MQHTHVQGLITLQAVNPTHTKIIGQHLTFVDQRQPIFTAIHQNLYRQFALQSLRDRQNK